MTEKATLFVDLNSRHHYQVHRDDILAWRKSRGI